METYPRLRLGLDVGAVVIAVVALVVSVLANSKSTEVAEKNLQLAQQAAQADAAVDAALVDFADHSDRLYIRNASRRPMVRVALVRATYGSENAPSSTYKPLGKAELPDLLSCRDVQFNVPPLLRRSPPKKPEAGAANDFEAPFWMLIWSDAAGQRWEKSATESDVDGGLSDLSFLYEADDVPASPVNNAGLDTALVTQRLAGLDHQREWPIGNSGKCK